MSTLFQLARSRIGVSAWVDWGDWHGGKKWMKMNKDAKIVEERKIVKEVKRSDILPVAMFKKIVYKLSWEN